MTTTILHGAVLQAKQGWKLDTGVLYRFERKTKTVTSETFAQPAYIPKLTDTGSGPV